MYKIVPYKVKLPKFRKSSKEEVPLKTDLMVIATL